AASVHRGDDELGAILDARRPTLRDRLDLGVELDRLRAVLVEVAEAGLLPAAERVVGDRDGDRDVDADHADLDAGDELTCGVAVAREDGHAVSVLVLVGQSQRVVETLVIVLSVLVRYAALGLGRP